MKQFATYFLTILCVRTLLSLNAILLVCARAPAPSKLGPPSEGYCDGYALIRKFAKRLETEGLCKRKGGRADKLCQSFDVLHPMLGDHPEREREKERTRRN